MENEKLWGVNVGLGLWFWWQHECWTHKNIGKSGSYFLCDEFSLRYLNLRYLCISSASSGPVYICLLITPTSLISWISQNQHVQTWVHELSSNFLFQISSIPSLNKGYHHLPHGPNGMQRLPSLYRLPSFWLASKHQIYIPNTIEYGHSFLSPI